MTDAGEAARRSTTSGRAGGPPAPPAPGASALGTGRLETAQLGAFTLESGTTLPALTVAYRHDGPGPAAAPQALVIHALTGSADAAGDWWEPLIGPGRAFDTRRVGVLCANLLGGRYGSTGPTSLDPSSGAPYGAAFPDLTSRDQARAQWALLDALGIDRLVLVSGGSLGGMVALEVALERPDRVAAVLPMAAPAATGPLAIAWDRIQLELIERLGEDGLALARQLAMTTYRSESDFAERFGRAIGPDGRPEVVSYLAHQGRKLVERFDPDTYRVLVGAMDRHDIGRGRGGIGPALGRLAGSGTRLTGLGIAGDILYGPAQVRALVDAAEAAGVEAAYRQLNSPKGHDAFLVEWPQLTGFIEEALRDALAAAAA
jgi:homoserine O-acetyltransferase/O-succinyltransferase